MTILKMNPDEYSISAEYVPLLVELVEKRGIASSVLLEGSDMVPDLWKEPSGRISAEQFDRLMRRVFDLTGEAWLGWEFGAMLTMSTHGFLGYAALSSDTLGEALATAVRYLRTRITVLDLSLTVEDGEAILQLEELIALEHAMPFLLETVFSSFWFMSLKVLDESLFVGTEVRFAHAEPEYYRRLKPMVPMPVMFDSPAHQVRFPEALLSERLRFADPRLARMAAAQCERELSTIKAPPGLLSQVRRIILTHPRRFPSVEEAASELHMSSRTLKRKLQQLGTSYQRILDDLRKGLAVEKLTRTRSTVDEIALMLGYSDASNFARAFRRWTGKSPSDYRDDA